MITRKQIFYETPVSWLYPIPDIKADKAIESIANMVSEFYNIPVEDMQQKTRKREITEARQISMYMVKAFTKNSLKTIGQWFGGRDHTTVIHSCQTVKDLMDSDPEYKRQIIKLKSLIN